MIQNNDITKRARNQCKVRLFFDLKLDFQFYSIFSTFFSIFPFIVQSQAHLFLEVTNKRENAIMHLNIIILTHALSANSSFLTKRQGLLQEFESGRCWFTNDLVPTPHFRKRSEALEIHISVFQLLNGHK